MWFGTRNAGAAANVTREGRGRNGNRTFGVRISRKTKTSSRHRPQGQRARPQMTVHSPQRPWRGQREACAQQVRRARSEAGVRGRGAISRDLRSTPLLLHPTLAQCTLKEFSNYSPQNQAETKILRGGFIPREWRLALSRTREPAPSSIFRESTSTRCFSLNLEFRTPKVLLCKPDS